MQHKTTGSSDVTVPTTLSSALTVGSRTSMRACVYHRPSLRRATAGKDIRGTNVQSNVHQIHIPNAQNTPGE